MTLTRFVIYIRCSTNGQIDGYGLDVQEKDCRAMVARLGGEVVRVCKDEGVSGELDAADRPGLTCALDLLRAGDVDAVAIPSLSRLGRKLVVQEAVLALLWDAGAQVHAVDSGEVPVDDPEDYVRTFIRQVLGAINQMDKAAIKSKLRKGRKAKLLDGGYGGGPAPLGQVVVRDERGKASLVADPDGVALIERMQEMRTEPMTYEAIAMQLAAENVPTARGGSWTAATVRRILIRTQS